MWGRPLERRGVGFLMSSRCRAFAVLLASSLLLVPTGQAQALAPPSPPQDVEVAATADGVQVTWAAPLFTGGSTSITYRVYRDSALLADQLTTTSFLDESLASASASAATYSYTVTAVNEKGESAHSGGNCIDLSTVPPGVAPGNCVVLVIELVFWVIDQVTNLTSDA